MGLLTVITVTSPDHVGKTFSLDKDGKLQKHASADVWQGTGQVVDIPDARAMAALLAQVTAANNLVLVNGTFKGVAIGEHFAVTTSRRLQELVEREGGDYDAVRKRGTAYVIKTGPNAGCKIVARIKDMQGAAGWLLLDADEPVGFPAEWRDLSFQQRLELLEPVAPGISTAERVELRGSSARVVRQGSNAPLQPASHGWVQVDDADDVARAAVSLGVHVVGAGIYFNSPRFSCSTGAVIGASVRTSIDLAPWHRGRLNFDSAPVVRAEGYTVAPAGITIVNEGGGPFRPGGVAVVTPKATRVYREKTGNSIVISGRGSSARTILYGQLTPGTLIEAQGVMKPLSAWLSVMAEQRLTKLRCEAPFRASTSESSFIGFSGDGSPFVYDVGIATQFHLAQPIDDDGIDGDDPTEIIFVDAEAVRDSVGDSPEDPLFTDADDAVVDDFQHAEDVAVEHAGELLTDEPDPDPYAMADAGVGDGACDEQEDDAHGE